MADRVYPSAKPVAVGGSVVAPPAAVSAPPGPAKPQIYNPNRQPYSHSRRTRRKRCGFCCCFFWTLLVILLLALIIGIAGVAFWVVYRPHYPVFTVSNFRIANLNLSSTSEGTAHLRSSMNLTLTVSNRNKKISFFYDDFDLSVFSSSDIQISNGSATGFVSLPRDGKSVKLELNRADDLDAESAKGLKSDLKKKSLQMKVRMMTKVRVKIGKMKTKKVGIRVTCSGIKGNAPTGKIATVASTADAKCDVDLRIKIWKFTF